MEQVSARALFAHLAGASGGLSHLTGTIVMATVLVAVMILPAPALAADGPSGADSAGPATPEQIKQVRAFLDRAEAELMNRWIAAERAAWVQETYITDDTSLIAARAAEEKISTTVRLAGEAARFNGLDLPYDLDRKLGLIRRGLTLPAPDDPGLTAELARIMASLNSAYGTGKYCPDGPEHPDACLDLGELSKIMATSRDPERLLEAWLGWRTVSAPMRDDFSRYVELANQGARGLGFDDLGAMWRSKYDMDPDAFAAEVNRLWEQLRPLYESLHCYVRARLAAVYGEDLVPLDQPIPAHLLGNMWAQSWSNIYPLVAPADAQPGPDLTELLQQRKLDAMAMARIGEQFYSSLGFEPLPETFWERSLFTKPRDREVVCHASAWDIDWEQDLRIKMCIEPTEEDFVTIHHELGHNYYQRAYSHLDPLYRDSANDGFHEAVGDTLALSITPSYLVKLDFLDTEPATNDVDTLLRLALDKIAFLPFGLLVDQYRWSVFSGEISPDSYNKAWWELRERYQGVRAPAPRSEADLDPGAKYHVAANVPYTRYFLAGILQFQMHRALCKAAGYEGPLNRCSIYGSKEAGKRLQAMLAMGQSRPWPDALEALGAGREMDATAILDYRRLPASLLP